MKNRPFSFAEDDKVVTRSIPLSAASNEALIEIVRENDTELADELAARLSFYFKELNWLQDKLREEYDATKTTNPISPEQERGYKRMECMD